MSSFINFNNRGSVLENKYSAEVIKTALLKSETKSSAKAESLTKNIKEPVSLNEALVFFTDKLGAIRQLNQSIVEVNEGRVKQFEMDYASMVKDIKRGYGWIDPEYVAQTWDNSSDSIDFELVRDELFDRLIAAGLLAHADDNNPEEAGKYIKSVKDLYVMESEVEEISEGRYYAFHKGQKHEIEADSLWGAKQKAITDLKVKKKDVGMLAIVLADSHDDFSKGKNSEFAFEGETTVYESATAQLADEEKFELYTATLKNKTATLKATTTTKTWDDGVPVLKYLARGKGKPTQVNINGSFEVAHDVARGWFYFTDGRKWFGLHIGDGYSDIDDLPFDMEVKESVVTEAKFVKEFDKAVLDAETEKDVLKVYPKAEFHVGKLSHFFGELEPNLFFKAYYAKYYKQDTGNKIDGEFKITSVYSEKGSNYVHLYNESVVNEGRSINKIQKEWSDITTKMLQKVSEWKEAEGDRKSELLEELKGLTKQKAELEKELDAKVAGKDKDVQLAISEDHSSNPNDKYEVRPCDEEGTPWAVWEGDVRVECFATEEEAHAFADKQNQEQELEEGNAFGAARAEAIAKGEKEFEVDGETFKVEDIDAEDKENAEEFVEESKITLDSLVEMFTEKETITEDLRSEVKKFIKQNNKELDELADQDQWDIMYQKLYDEFEVEADSTKGKDLLKTFQFTY